MMKKIIEKINVTVEVVRESNNLKKIALDCCAKNRIKYINNKDKYAWKLIKFDLKKFAFIKT